VALSRAYPLLTPGRLTHARETRSPAWLDYLLIVW
jgi:hypothetical protein